MSTKLPSWAQGDWVIPSLGQFEMNDRKFVGALDAFGKMQRFELKEDEVCATYRIMDTGFYNESVQRNTIGRGLLFFETDPPRKCPVYDPVCNIMGANDNTFVNTFKVGGKLLSNTDGPAMLELDPQSMAVKGLHKWNDKLQGQVCYSGSAHPLPHPTTGEWVDFISNGRITSQKTDVRVYSLSDDDPGNRKSITDVETDLPPYMHSFGLTSKYMVFPRMPVAFDSKSIFYKPMHEAFIEVNLTADSPAEDNSLMIVPLDGGKPIVRPLPIDQKLYYTHVVNTYENESGVVIDICTRHSNPFASNLTVAGVKDKALRDTAKRDVVKRFVLPLDIKQPVTVEIISDPDAATDFTQMNHKFAGLKHCFYWADQWYTEYKTYGAMAIVKYDLCGGAKKLEFYRPNWFPSEPTFIGSNDDQAAEDDGILVFTALNGQSGETSLMILDSKTMAVISEVGPFPRIAFTTHGEFYPKATAVVESANLFV